MIGKTIGKYQIIDKIGEGGMGTVYKAEDTTLHRLVALKTLSSHLAENEEARIRFIREAEAASSLNHPNITTIYELLEDEGQHHICMEYVEGKTIRHIIESGHVSVRKAVDIIMQAAEALETAHAKGILHRDIKSSNIMVSMEGRVKVMDFGLAHLEDKSQLTRTGTTMGTLAYSAPEQLTGRGIDKRSEIWSLGVVFYELLTGQLPFKSPSEGELVFAIINNEQDKPSKIRDDVPESVCAVINRMLLKQPELRYQNCGELINDLNAIRSELETTTVQIPTALSAMKAKRRKQLVIGLGAVVIAAGIIIILLIGTAGSMLDPNTIVVADYTNMTQGAAPDQIGSYMATRLVDGIRHTNLLNVVDSDRSSPASRKQRQRAQDGVTPDPVKALAEETHAGIAVSGEYYLTPENTLEFHTRVRDIRRGKTTELSQIRGPLLHWTDLAENLRQVVLATLATNYDPRFESFIQDISQPQSYEAVVQFNEGLDIFYGLREIPPGANIALQTIPVFLKAFEIDSTYVSALIWAARMAQQNAGPYSTAFADSLITIADSHRDRMTDLERLQLDAIKHGYSGDLASRYRVLRQIIEINPGTYWTFVAAQIAGMAGYPKEGLQYYDMIDPYGNTIQAPMWWYVQRPYALLLAGEFKELVRHIEKTSRIFNLRGTIHPGEYGAALSALGRKRRLFNWLEELDTNPGYLTLYARTIARTLKYHGYLNIYEEFIRWFEERVESFPPETTTRTQWRGNYALFLILTERFEEAYEIAKALNAANPLTNNVLIGVAAAEIGDREEALIQIDRLEERFGNGNYHQQYSKMWRQAAIYAHVGEIERALNLLEECVQYGDGYLGLLQRIDYFEPLWDQTPFRALMSPGG